ncbi:MAG: hypothetical protein KKB30_16590 [Proteobacteria bacterium]|nr:hypothetical protein [Pseudomonadota bacterium]MBU1715783.1 hypothetical protein [Pseudomonadota bacterium]
MIAHDLTIFKTGFDQVCMEFETIQQEQLSALKAGNLKDVMSWHDRREKSFLRLQQYLGKVADEFDQPEDLAFLGEFQERLGLLLATEKVLDKAAVACRKVVVDKLGDLRRGKTALKGYSLKSGKALEARFLSSRS